MENIMFFADYAHAKMASRKEKDVKDTFKYHLCWNWVMKAK